jgi:cytochrome c556
LLCVLAVLSLAGAGVAATTKPRLTLPAAEHVPQRVQAEVKARMTDHAAAMSSFTQAVVLLDRARIESLAAAITEQEVIAAGATPMAESDRALLPRDFFVQQIALSAIARQLVAAAQQRDDQGLSNRFGALASTCVGCHSSYLQGRPGE